MSKTIRLIAVLVAMFGTLSVSAGNEILWGYYQGSGLSDWGTQKKENYDVAIHLTGKDLVGKQILAIRVPVNTNAENAGNYRCWLSKKLKVENGLNVPDVLSVDFTPGTSTWTEVTLETPYTIDEDGIYVGCSFDLSLATTFSEGDGTPVKTTPVETEDGLLIHTSETYKEWTSVADKGASALVVRLGGDKVKEYSASLVAPTEIYAQLGQATKVPLTVINHGTKIIKSVNYEIAVGDTVVKRRATVTVGTAYYGKSASIEANVPALTTKGTYDATFTITKVNSVENEDEYPSAVTSIACLATFPKHKPLVEEYTGTWCGWCTRGLVAMDLLLETYGEDFVGAAYHSGDPMQTTQNFPTLPGGYPSAYIDRVVDCDPYYGTGNSAFGIKSDWTKRSEVVAPASIDLEAAWTNDNKTALEVTSHVTFIRSFRNSPYRLTYILVADDLHNASSTWNQANYYSGYTAYANDPNLKPIIQMGSSLNDYHFNDVVVQSSSSGARALEQSLPTYVEGEVPYEHSYTFYISSNELIQDKSKLRVLALLVDTETGEVVNANKVEAEASTGIDASVEDNKAESVVYTDLSGRRIDTFGKGIFVKTMKYPDGSQRSVKFINK